MDLDDFKTSLDGPLPPAGLSPMLEALWHDGHGDWDAAHSIIQDHDSGGGAWVHAYLHRKEGDFSNASYWYRRAGQPVASGPLDREWAALVQTFLNRG